MEKKTEQLQAAAEKAADQIILDVWHQQGGAAEATKAATTPPAAKNSGAKKAEQSALDPRRIVVAALNAISGEAHAQNVDFNASSPQIEQIKARMASRFGELRPFLDSGAIGLTADGLIAVHDANAASLADRARMNQRRKQRPQSALPSHRGRQQPTRLGRTNPENLCRTLDQPGTKRLVVPKRRRLEEKINRITT